MSYMDGSAVPDSLEEDNNVIEVDFTVPRSRPTTGGRPPSDCWITRFRTGTCFLVRPKSFDGWMLREFCHGGTRGTALLLITVDQGQRMEMNWIDPVRFCQQFDLYEITEEPEDEVLCDS